jgi:hypothetical protein
LKPTFDYIVVRFVQLSFSSSSSDLTNTNTSKNNERKLVKIRELVLVRRLGEVADLGDVDDGVAEVVPCKRKKNEKSAKDT